MWSVGGQAQVFRGVAGGRAPHNAEGESLGASLDARRRGSVQRDQMSLCSPLSPWTSDA